jgi:hypothetical protein
MFTDVLLQDVFRYSNFLNIEEIKSLVQISSNFRKYWILLLYQNAVWKCDDNSFQLNDKIKNLKWNNLQPVDLDVLPRGLTNLRFGVYFNQPIFVLPRELTNLSFGYYFNQPIGSDVLPRGLTNLRFGSKFNQPIGSDVLPRGLTNLSFGYDFNQPIGSDVLPKMCKVNR